MFSLLSRGPTRVADVTLTLSLTALKRLSRILLIEDRVETFPLELLRNEGYSIDHWEQVKDLRRLEAREYDVVVLDIHGVAEQWSENEGGLSVLQHLKKHVPGLAVVAFSGQSFDLTRHHFFQQADDVLSKPVDAVKCKQVLDGVLRTHFTASHIWNTIRGTLKAQGQTDETLDKLERDIARAMRKDPSKIREVAERVAPYIKTTAQVGTLLVKLSGLAQS